MEKWEELWLCPHFDSLLQLLLRWLWPFHSLLRWWLRFSHFELCLWPPFHLLFCTCGTLLIPCCSRCSGFRISSCACGRVLFPCCSYFSRFRHFELQLQPHFQKKATALKCARKNSLVPFAQPLLKVALPSLDKEVETNENSLTTYSSSLLSSLRFFFFEEHMSNQRSYSGINVQDEQLWKINRFGCAFLISIEDSLQIGRCGYR